MCLRSVTVRDGGVLQSRPNRLTVLTGTMEELRKFFKSHSYKTSVKNNDMNILSEKFYTLDGFTYQLNTN